jgi:hypothetical protein
LCYVQRLHFVSVDPSGPASIDPNPAPQLVAPRNLICAQPNEPMPQLNTIFFYLSPTQVSPVCSDDCSICPKPNVVCIFKPCISLQLG